MIITPSNQETRTMEGTGGVCPSKDAPSPALFGKRGIKNKVSGTNRPPVFIVTDHSSEGSLPKLPVDSGQRLVSIIVITSPFIKTCIYVYSYAYIS